MAKQPTNTDQTQIIFMCSAEQTQFLNAEAKRQSITRTGVIRHLIQDKIKKLHDKILRVKRHLARTT